MENMEAPRYKFQKSGSTLLIIQGWIFGFDHIRTLFGSHVHGVLNSAIGNDGKD